jgi:hypothetical protein
MSGGLPSVPASRCDFDRPPARRRSSLPTAGGTAAATTRRPGRTVAAASGAGPPRRRPSRRRLHHTRRYLPDRDGEGAPDRVGTTGHGDERSFPRRCVRSAPPSPAVAPRSAPHATSRPRPRRGPHSPAERSRARERPDSPEDDWSGSCSPWRPLEAIAAAERRHAEWLVRGVTSPFPAATARSRSRRGTARDRRHARSEELARGSG